MSSERSRQGLDASYYPRGQCLLILVFLVFMVLPLSATTYYVDNCVSVGNDSNNGTDPSTPWLTIAHVVSHGLSAGDSVLFERTCTWREQLTVGWSGTAGNVITFADYGSGAKPMFNGSDLVTGWSLTSGTTYQTAVTFTPHQAFRNNVRLIADVSTPTVDGHWYWASTVFYLCCGDPTSLTIEASHRDAGVSVTNKSHLAFTNLNLVKSNTQSSAGILLFAEAALITDITVTGVDVSYNWGRGILFYDNDAGTFSNITLTGDTSDHDGLGRIGTVAGLHIGEGGVGASGGGITNLTMTNCHASYTGAHGGGGTDVTAFGSYLSQIHTGTVTNLEVDHNMSGGLAIGQESSDVTVTGGSAHDNGWAGDINNVGVGEYGTANNTNIVIQGMDIYNGGGYGVDISRLNDTPPRYVNAGLVFRYCRIHDNAKSGLHAGGHHTGMVLANNVIYNNGRQGIVVNEGTGDGVNPSSNGSPEVLYYGNTIYGNGTGGGSTNANVTVGSTSTAGSNAFVNNIFAATNGNELEVQSGGQNSFFSNYNDFYHAAGGTFLSWIGTAYSFANWKSNSGQDANSLSSNPTVTNAGANDYTLQAGSPAIGAGTNLGSTYQLALSPVSSWPSNIVTANQNSYGTGWEIGAYAFKPSRPLPPSNLRAKVH